MNWKEFFDRLGMNGTWWQWRILRWQERRREESFWSACSLFMPAWLTVSNALLALNLLNLLTVLALFGTENLLRPDRLMLYRMGALDPFLFRQGEYWRIVTYAFLHIGLLHIAFNMIALSQIGPALERLVGAARLFTVYMLSLLGGGWADILVRGPVPMLIAGASGALFGLIGFGMSYAHFYGGAAGRAQRNFFLQWAAYGFLFGLLVRADNICHLGGFITGAVAGFLVERERSRAERLAPAWRLLALALAVALVAAFGWLIRANLRAG